MSQPERKKIQALVHELHSRGYRYGDIAILTQKNEDAVRATTWLNEEDIRFISYSSLDIRRRKITGEIVSLLNFLSSPTRIFHLSPLYWETSLPNQWPEILPK